MMHSPISWMPSAPALVTMPGYSGTLAAVRQLGSVGVQSYRRRKSNIGRGTLVKSCLALRILPPG